MGIILYMPLNAERAERGTQNTTAVFFTSFHYEPMDKCVASLKMLWGLDWLLITWDRFDVAAGNSWRTGLKPSRELRQMINNKDLVNDVCCCQQSLFLSHRMLFLWEAQREIVMFSCQRHAFICLFSRALKVVYYARGLSVSVSVSTDESVRATRLTSDDARKR